MITASNIYVQYGDRILLDHIDLVIGDRDKAGLVGRNGAGKSTLLKILAGHISPQEGRVSRPNDRSLAFLHQELELPKGKTVLDETLTAFEEARRLEERIREINQALEMRTDYESEGYHQLIEELTAANERFHLLLGGQAMEAEAIKVLKGLGFKDSDMHRLTDEFSGGWQMRVELAKMLLQQPDYLFLDEPTNHLDIESILWLESFLKNYPDAVVIISHDIEFLDNITRRTVEIELGKVFDYKAAYSEYRILREERLEKQRAAYENQQRLIAQRERTINRFMAKATKTRMAQSMQKQLDKMERIELDETDSQAMNLRFPPAPRSGQIVLTGKHLSKSYGDLLVLDQVDLQLERGQRVAFVGQNGQGKSTLAKIIVNDLPATEGRLKLGHNVSVGYYAQNQSETLHPQLTLLETMERASPPDKRSQLRNMLGAFLFSGEDVDKKVSVLSGGERARLALACLLLRPFNLLVLDESTNHLDIISKDILKRALLQYDGALIVVSHDREFLAGLTDRTVEFRDRKLHHYLGDVNYFLEKRQLNTMRQVERSPTNGQAATKDRKAEPLSREERKQMLRRVSNAEKKVERLENQIAGLEALMADPEFYRKPESQGKIEEHQKRKRELEQAMEEWEQAQLRLEEAGIQ
jgi:ATP-binding cassette subfamily F protein 3